ncbi:MAG: HupE/UreJ family protein [Candidatus Obscuribacterales bacterium]|nr:HupE/UreJ family protein [Steroidobacteraceae bacterium]
MKRLALLLGVGLLCSGFAVAHTSGASFIHVKSQSDSTLTSRFDFDVRDLNFILQLDANTDGNVSWGEIQDASARIDSLVLTRTLFSTTSGGCNVQSREPLAIAEHGDGPYVRLAMVLACTELASLTVDHSAWFNFDSGHRALLEYESADGSKIQTVLTQALPRWQAAESQATRLKRFFVEGIYHLLTGYDHLAFLAVLLLALARRAQPDAPVAPRPMLRRALTVVTAFTLAHSLTLGLAASGWLLLPSQPVEIVIAASVALAALANLGRNASTHSWKLALAFGLVHGLGFAGALAELSSAGVDLLALAAFNIGIELAQVGVAMLFVPLIARLFRSSQSERFALPMASLAVAGMAGVWIVERVG